MASHGFSFDTGDNGSRPDGFPGSSGQFWFGEEQNVVGSPDEFTLTLSNSDLDYLWSQLSSIENPPSLDARAHTDARDWPSQLHNPSAQYHTPVFNPPYSPTVIPTTHQPSAILDAGRPSMSQGYSSVVVGGTTSVHDASYSPQIHLSSPGSTVPSYHDSSPMLVDQVKSFNSEIGTLYEKTPPAMTSSFSSIPSGSAFQPTVPRSPIKKIQRQNSQRGSTVTSSHYPPIRTSSLPVQASSLEEAVSHTCQWMKADGTICEAPITWAGVPKHLTTHGVENLANNHRVSCKWFRCRIKGNHDMLNRESIVRHVREKHLGYRRTL